MHELCYQIHLNYPTVVTTDPLAHMCRDEIVLRCKAAFGQLLINCDTSSMVSADVGGDSSVSVGTRAGALSEASEDPSPPLQPETIAEIDGGSIAEALGDIRGAAEDASTATGQATQDVDPIGPAGSNTSISGSNSSISGRNTSASGREGPFTAIDWERVIDFPHGSLRLLGSRKTHHMDGDPAWVRDKAYYPVVWEPEQRRWRPAGVHHALLMQMSIFPDPRQVRWDQVKG